MGAQKWKELRLHGPRDQIVVALVLGAWLLPAIALANLQSLLQYGLTH